jgi:KaiC/GvpD/RAD55 family RecA-like ATPase
MSINVDKQKLLIEYLLSSPDTFALCSGIVESEYFDPELKNSVTFIKDYYEKYHSIPSVDQVRVETGNEFTTRQVTFPEIQYCANEVEAFCKRRGLERAILASPALIQEGDYGGVEEMIRNALTISLQRNMGLEYFHEPHKRLLALKDNNSVCSLGYPEVDELLDGGLKRKEMLLLSGNSGAGKSVTMSNLALNFMAQGLDVLIISLELSEELIAKRFDTMITGVGSVELIPRMREVATILESKRENLGNLYIVRMPTGSNTNSFRAYLKEFELKHKKVPDVLIVDYLDLMGANEYTRPGDTFDKDKRASEQLRDLVHDYNMYLITASQQNRSAVDATDLNHSHIAGGISKINTTDIYISIIMNDQMRARGEIAFQFLKTRSSNGVGKTAHLGWSGKTLRITSNRCDNNKKLDFVSRT